MAAIEIQLRSNALRALRRHLLPKGSLCEEAAFLCTKYTAESETLVLRVIDVVLIPPDGFTSRSRFYLELTDATRASVIKRAHDLGAALIECHSHPSQHHACFSWSDLHGFDECVPHVQWRLANRPYAAVVFSPRSFDALAWSGKATPPTSVRCIRTEHAALAPTGLTLINWRDIYDRQPL